MSTITAEFTVEPFEPSAPGPHVTAAIEAAETMAGEGVVVDIGPFGTAVTGPPDEVLTIIDSVNRAAMANGATRLSVQITTDPS